MSAWLIDTLVYSGALIGLVLLVRKPVARMFGPQVAYALWALPLLRFLLPPIVLPSSMAPAETPVADAPLMVIISDNGVNAASASVPPPVPAVGIELIDLLLPFWLLGAAVFLMLRARDYLRMKEALLADARPVGEFRNVALVETPAVTSPVAFGVRRKVVALPMFFMATRDREVRDMAIAHELAHHRGHDLLANIAAQPVLALHWFNPLAWWGWRAMRRDQEAACDARVMAGKLRHERAAYAQVIAGFAAGEHLSLAAPMACPVLGEKSIVHRLRSLTMNEVTPGRKRLGIAAIATTALVALPLSASISYAAAEAPVAPDAPLPPAAPLAPVAPLAPHAPEAPQAPAVPDYSRIYPEARDVRVSVERDEEGRVTRREVIVDGKRVDADDHEGFWDEAAFERSMEQMERDLERAEAERERALDRAEQVREAALERAERAREQAMRSAERGRARAEAGRARAEAAREVALARADMHRVQFDGNCDGNAIVQSRDLGNGRTATLICAGAIDRTVHESIREAMAEIRDEGSLTEEQRREILRGLQHELDTSGKLRHGVSAVVTVPVPPSPPAPPVVRTSLRVSATAMPVAVSWSTRTSDADCEKDSSVTA